MATKPHQVHCFRFTGVGYDAGFPDPGPDKWLNVLKPTSKPYDPNVHKSCSYEPSEMEEKNDHENTFHKGYWLGMYPASKQAEMKQADKSIKPSSNEVLEISGKRVKGASIEGNDHPPVITTDPKALRVVAIRGNQTQAKYFVLVDRNKDGLCSAVVINMTDVCFFPSHRGVDGDKITSDKIRGIDFNSKTCGKTDPNFESKRATRHRPSTSENTDPTNHTEQPTSSEQEAEEAELMEDLVQPIADGIDANRAANISSESYILKFLLSEADFDASKCLEMLHNQWPHLLEIDFTFTTEELELIREGMTEFDIPVELPLLLSFLVGCRLVLDNHDKIPPFLLVHWAYDRIKALAPASLKKTPVQESSAMAGDPKAVKKRTKEMWQGILHTLTAVNDVVLATYRYVSTTPAWGIQTTRQYFESIKGAAETFMGSIWDGESETGQMEAVHTEQSEVTSTS